MPFKLEPSTKRMRSYDEFNERITFHLFDLPQELLEIIFDLAYPRSDHNHCGLKAWNAYETIKRKRDGPCYVRRPPPPPKVTEFLVCKRFFALAARAYVTNQLFVFGAAHIFPLHAPDMPLFHNYATTIKMEDCGTWCLGEDSTKPTIYLLRRLRDLDGSFSPFLFDVGVE